jgi:hypothetical protein
MGKRNLAHHAARPDNSPGEGYDGFTGGKFIKRSEYLTDRMATPATWGVWIETGSAQLFEFGSALGL